MSEAKYRFDDFVRAVTDLDLDGKDVKATAHTSAVTLRWDRVKELAREEKAADDPQSPA